MPEIISAQIEKEWQSTLNETNQEKIKRENEAIKLLQELAKNYTSASLIHPEDLGLYAQAADTYERIKEELSLDQKERRKLDIIAKEILDEAAFSAKSN